MKHYILTRFAAWVCPNTGMTLKKLFSKEYIDSSMNKLTTALIPTLENQTVKNFELLILVHDAMPDEIIQKLQAIHTTLKFNVVRVGDTVDYIKNDSKNYNCVVFSRIDIDDFILDNVVEQIQVTTDTCSSDYVFIGLHDGATYTPNDNTVCWMPSYTYNKKGAWSSMITLACKRKKHIEYLDVCGKTPLSYEHTRMFADIANIISSKDTYDIRYIHSTNMPLYLWTFWGDNGTNMIREQNNKNTSWHKTDNKIHVDFKKFGI